jgi:glucose-1-phosphate cytidylyltransferase
MKVVLFCGGLGLRMGEASARVPKPMVSVGARPILWHIMRYYAHFGHKEFILCLGYQASVIKDFFLNYNEALSNDFVLGQGGQIEVFHRDMDEWRITFVDTGLQSNVGERLRRVRPHLDGDEMFLAHYGDTLTDAPLPQLVEELEKRPDGVANFLCVRPSSYSFHTVHVGPDQRVRSIQDVHRANIWINGGYFVLRQAVFDYMEPGEELVEAPFQRLIEQNRLLAHRYEGFWAPMDTLKDRQNLEALAESGRPPWAVWEEEAELADSQRKVEAGASLPTDDAFDPTSIAGL